MSTEQIKDLLKEIMKTRDPELIQLATEMLKNEQADVKQSPPSPQPQAWH